MPMKTKRKFTVVIERDVEGYYVASVPALRRCYTQAKNPDTLMKRVREEWVGIQQVSV
jgi:predicted RNase H-like HicB family nuclease